MPKDQTVSKPESAEQPPDEGLLVQRLVRLYGLDRRFRYSIHEGMLCKHGKCTVPCSGCSCDGEYPCSCCTTRGAGCDWCGYTGKHVSHFPIPVMHEGKIIETNCGFIPTNRPMTTDQPPTGIEARVCEDIAARQRLGIAKYGRTVEQSPDDMLSHAYEEALDLAVYLKADIERGEWRPIETAPRGSLDEHGEDTLFDLWAGGERHTDCWWQVFPMSGEGAWAIEKHASGSFTCIKNPTHWMPLPPPPAERSDHE